MKRANLCVSAVLVVALACGCANGSKHANTRNRQAVISLNTTANDEAAGPDERCRAVFSLFQQFIKPGSTPSEIHEVLTDTRWLAQTNIQGIYVVTGWVPVEWEPGKDTSFVVSVLPQLKPSSGRPPNLGYHIYFTLAGGASRSEESAFAILTSRQTRDSKAVLKEFALCYSDGTIERVTKSGSRKFNIWANHTIQRMRASRLAQLRFVRPGRLALTADGSR